MLTIRKGQGFVLIEIIIVVVISAIIATIGVPAYQRFTQNMQARQEIARLKLVVDFTRNQAVATTSRTTLCPLDSSGQCINDWNNALSVFNDKNNNRRLDSDEAQLTSIAATTDPAILRSFNGSVISFDDRGFAGSHTGSLSYCLQGQVTRGAVFIISRIGRVRPGYDQNDDDLPELPDGNNIPCPAG